MVSTGTASFAVLFDRSLDNAHILYWAVIGIGLFLLYPVNNIKPVYHLAEHGIFSVQMGRSAYHLIVVRHEMIVFIAFFFPGRSHLVERGWSHLPAPDDLELTAAAAAFGIDIIAFTGSSYHATLVIQVRQAEFGRQGIA